MKRFFPRNPGSRLLGSWIPPFGIVSGLCAFAFSWILLLRSGLRTAGGHGPSLFEKLAFVHTLAIGFFTLTALSVLFHVMPAFTNTPWIKEKTARKTLPILAAGWIGMTVFFLEGFRPVWAWGIFLVAAALLLWGSLFFLSMGKYLEKKGLSGSPLLFFLLPVGFLTGTALLGGTMGEELASGRPQNWIQTIGIPVHLAMGLLGWLTLLLWIVSSRTQKPILGAHSRHPERVSLSIWLLGAGVMLFAAGQITGNGLPEKSGFIFMGIAVFLYLSDAFGLLFRSSAPHAILRVWWATGTAGLLASALAGGWLVLHGFYQDTTVFVYLVLVCWIEPFLLGHLHQIGVRLLATLVRGPQDMTPPAKILSDRFSWLFWLTDVLAALSGLAGVSFSNSPLLILSGSIGILSSILLGGHIHHMINKCRSMKDTDGIPPTLVPFPEASSPPVINTGKHPL